MEVRRYSYVDVYYSRGEGKKAKRERKRLEKAGYELQVTDLAGGKFKYCDQYLKSFKTLEK